MSEICPFRSEKVNVIDARQGITSTIVQPCTKECALWHDGFKSCSFYAMADSLLGLLTWLELIEKVMAGRSG